AAGGSAVAGRHAADRRRGDRPGGGRGGGRVAPRGPVARPRRGGTAGPRPRLAATRSGARRPSRAPLRRAAASRLTGRKNLTNFSFRPIPAVDSHSARPLK